jgi:16S rRNA (uracil1498-N3)-methyltransferase
MPRFHLPPESWPSGVLTGDEARHLTQVLRIRPGDSVSVFDGCGNSASATVLSTAKDNVALSLGETTHSPPIRPAITLAQAIPKQKNMDLIVQKAVELGVTTIQPLVTRHTIVHPGDGKADKWRRIALEACKQCGQNTLPTIAEPLPFDRWLSSEADIPPASHDLRIIASLATGAKPLRDWLKADPAPTQVTLLIGPEGDFSHEETQAALASGFRPATLGSIVLRVETASLFCLSAIRYEYPA